MQFNTELPRVSAVIAIHDADAVLLKRQLDSLFGQEGVKLRVVAVIDDEDAVGQLGAYPLTLVRVAGPAGIRNAFARGLVEALAENAGAQEYFAFCDQDDVWHPHKLQQSVAALEASGAALVHCDARVVDRHGDVIAASLQRYEGREQAHGLFGHIILNAVTGMTSVFTRETAELANRILADLESDVLHDHVAAVAAAAIGSTLWLDQPLVDYVQHAANSLGAVAARQRCWWKFSVSAHAIAAYRQTSANVFDDRRAIAARLCQAGGGASRLAEMFMVDRRPGRWRLIWLYTIMMWTMVLRGQRRRAIWCWRLADAALCHRKRISAKT